MKINLYNTHSPCKNCYARGVEYSENNEYCWRCEYNIYVQILKEVLSQNDGCSLCIHSESLGGGYLGYDLEYDIGCKKCDNYTINLNAVIEDYKLDVDR